MELANFFHPETLEEAKMLVHKLEGAKILAGGTDLVLNLKRGEVQCHHVIFLGKIKELKEIVDEGDFISIGAMVTFTDLIHSDIIRSNFNSLVNCCSTMGAPQIRNVATLGGNIINAGSAADAVTCIIALEGILVFESVSGIRRVSCEDYFSKYGEEKIERDEILKTIVIPKTKALSGYYKLGKRNSLAIARVSSAIKLFTEGGVVKGAKICVGAVGRYPFRVIDLEERAQNEEVLWLFKEEALSYLSAAVEKSIGGRKTMVFKREAIKGVFKEALKAALREEDISRSRGERS